MLLILSVVNAECCLRCVLFILSFVNAECGNAECSNSKCGNAECGNAVYAECGYLFKLSVVYAVCCLC